VASYLISVTKNYQLFQHVTHNFISYDINWLVLNHWQLEINDQCQFSLLFYSDCKTFTITRDKSKNSDALNFSIYLVKVTKKRTIDCFLFILIVFILFSRVFREVVNFTNILQVAFLFESILQSFLLLII